MHNIINLWKFELNFGCRSCEIIMEEKTPLSHEVVCFQMLGFETSKSNSEVSKSKSFKITSFSKTIRYFRGSRFSQCFILPRIWGLEIKRLKAHNFVSRNFDDWLSSNFHMFVIVCICWDTPTVKTSLWQLLPIWSNCLNSIVINRSILLCY